MSTLNSIYVATVDNLLCESFFIETPQSLKEITAQSFQRINNTLQ